MIGCNSNLQSAKRLRSPPESTFTFFSTSSPRNKNDQKIKEYLGDINYFLEQRNLENMREVEKKDVAKAAAPKESNKTSYEDQKKRCIFDMFIVIRKQQFIVVLNVFF